MKVVTTPETCIAAQQCSKSAPNVFGNSDDGGFVELLNAHPTDPADQDGAREPRICARPAPSTSKTTD